MKDIPIKIAAILAIAVVAILVILINLFLFIWSLNTLFGMNIEHTPINYLASFILIAFMRATYTKGGSA